MVCVRVRPPNKKEINQNNIQQKKTQIEVVKIQDDMVCLVDSDNVNNQGQINNNINTNQDSFQPSTSDQNSKKDRQYLFDYAFNQNDSTSYIFQKCISSLLDNVLIGYNATVFAYGQTGAGKTFTLFGKEFNHLNNELVVNENNQQGIVFESVKDLFYKIKQHESEDVYDVKISYLEIYNEKVHDLLIPIEDQSPLMIIEDTDRGVYVPDLTEYTIKEASEIFTYIKKGNKNRVMASTGSNQFSSRSHCMLQFNIEKKKKIMDVKNQIETSKLCLIDLAGSERAAISDNRGLRMQEGANINRSLLALGNCINILSDNQKKGAFVPYRDSKLTRLLKDSLGGNTKSIMLACIAPTYLTIEETLNTLKYAQRARKIKKTVEQNVKEVEMHISAYKDIISSLRGEITHLKQYYDDLSQKIFSNLEECWEIQQSLKDLKQLNEQNEHDLQIKTQELERIKQDQPLNQQEFQMVNEQIKELKSIIQNNQNIYYDILKNMEQNQAEKRQIQQLVQTNISYTNNKQNNSQENLQQQKTYLSNYQEASIMRPKSNDKIVQMELEMIQMKIELQQKHFSVDQNHQAESEIINQQAISQTINQKNDEKGKRQGLLKRQGSGSKSQKQLNNFEFYENPQKAKEKISSTAANLHGSYQGNKEKNKKQLQQYIKSPYNFKNSQNNLNNQNNRNQQTNRKDSERSANNNRKNMGKIGKAISNNVSKEKNEQDLIKQFEQALEQQQKEKEKNKHNYELSIKQNKKTQLQKNQNKNCKEKIHNKSVLPKRNSYQSTIKEFQDKKANLNQKNVAQKNMGIRSVSPQQKQNYLKFQEKKQDDSVNNINLDELVKQKKLKLQQVTALRNNLLYNQNIFADDKELNKREINEKNLLSQQLRDISVIQEKSTPPSEDKHKKMFVSSQKKRQISKSKSQQFFEKIGVKKESFQKYKDSQRKSQEMTNSQNRKQKESGSKQKDKKNLKEQIENINNFLDDTMTEIINNFEKSTGKKHYENSPTSIQGQSNQLSSRSENQNKIQNKPQNNIQNNSLKIQKQTSIISQLSTQTANSQNQKQSKYNSDIQNLKLQQGEIDLITHYNNNKKKNTQALIQINNNQIQTRQKSSFSSGNMENLQSTADFYQNFIQSQNESEKQNQNGENLQNLENNSQVQKVDMQIHVVEEEQDEDLENQSHNHNQIKQNSQDKNPQKKNIKNNQMFNITNLNQAREKIRNFKQNLASIYAQVQQADQMDDKQVQQIKEIINNFKNEIHVFSPQDDQILRNLQDIINQIKPELDQQRQKDDFSLNDMEYIKKFSKTTYNEQSNDNRFENQTKFENQQQDLEKIQKQNIQQIQQNNYVQNRPKKTSLYNQYSNNLNQGKQQVGILPGAFSKYNQNYSQNLNKIQKKASVTISTAQNSKSGIIQKQQNKVKSNKSQHELSEKPKQNQQNAITTPMGLSSLSQLAHNYKFGFNSQQITQQQKGFVQLQQNNQPYLYSPIQAQYIKNQSQNQQYSQSLQNSKQNISTGNNNNNLGNQLNKYANDNNNQTQNWGKNQGLSYIQLSQKQKQRNQSNNRYGSTKNSISSYKNILQKVTKSNQNLESSQN